MSQQHPTPWGVSESTGLLVDANGHSVIGSTSIQRRIVVCVNVLAECKTEDIEYCIEHKWTPFAGNVFASRVELQRERDELLTLLKTALPHIVGMGIREQAQAVISKLEGGK